MSTRMSTSMSTREDSRAPTRQTQTTTIHARSQVDVPVATRVDIRVDIGTRNSRTHDDRGGQGRRSRGAHAWAPCLEGPGRSRMDTMDEAGPSGPAWMRLVLVPRSTRHPDGSPAGGRGGLCMAHANVCVYVHMTCPRDSGSHPNGSDRTQLGTEAHESGAGGYCR